MAWIFYSTYNSQLHERQSRRVSSNRRRESTRLRLRISIQIRSLRQKPPTAILPVLASLVWRPGPHSILPLSLTVSSPRRLSHLIERLDHSRRVEVFEDQAQRDRCCVGLCSHRGRRQHRNCAECVVALDGFQLHGQGRGLRQRNPRPPVARASAAYTA